MSAQRTANQNASSAILGSRISSNCVRPGENTPPAEITGLLAKMRDGTSADFAALAALRGLSVAGIALASARGLLRFGRYHGRDAWFALDASQRNACARRVDGLPWLDGGAKSFILRGSQAAWPLGIGEAENFRTVLFCEGAPDLLAAFHFIAARGRVTDCAPVAMLSASYKIPAAALPMFAGKRVRIFAHSDAIGFAAAVRWTAQLKSFAGEIDAFSFAGICDRAGDEVKDLNGFARAQATDEAEKIQANLLP